MSSLKTFASNISSKETEVLNAVKTKSQTEEENIWNSPEIVANLSQGAPVGILPRGALDAFAGGLIAPQISHC
jgi:hypothetical protein